LGGSGDDVLVGDKGRDVLIGGEDSDRLVYYDLKESGVGRSKRDVITDFSASEGDKIDLSSIPGDFVFIGSSAFTGNKQEIRFADEILQMSTTNPGIPPDEFYTPLYIYHEPDSAPVPVFEIQLLGVDSLSVDDLIM